MRFYYAFDHGYYNLFIIVHLISFTAAFDEILRDKPFKWSDILLI